METPQLEEYRPIADRRAFRVLRTFTISVFVLGMIAGGASQYVEQTGNSATRDIAGAAFAVCIAVAILLGILSIFLSRDCPKCGKRMSRLSPGPAASTSGP